MRAVGGSVSGSMDVGEVKAQGSVSSILNPIRKLAFRLSPLAFESALDSNRSPQSPCAPAARMPLLANAAPWTGLASCRQWARWARLTAAPGLLKAKRRAGVI